MYKLTGRSFQSWKRFELPIKGFTIVVGPSNVGKSAILRSLRGVLRNEVSASQIQIGEKDSEVLFESSSPALKLVRNPKTTTYYVGSDEYSKLAGDVPEPVKKMGFGEVQVGSAKLDPIFASQFGPQFLLDLSPSELTAIFGGFASTERLDEGKKLAGQKNSEFSSEAKFLAKEIAREEEVKESLEKLVQELHEVEKLTIKSKAETDSLEEAIKLLEKLVKSKLFVEEHRKIPAELPDVSNLLEILSQGKNLVKLIQSRETSHAIDNILQASSFVPDFYSRLGMRLQVLNQLQDLISRKKRLSQYAQFEFSFSFSDVAVTYPLITEFLFRKKQIDDWKREIAEIENERENEEIQLSKLSNESIECPNCHYLFKREV